MHVALRSRIMTQAEFLAWTKSLEGRWEFDGALPVRMVDGTPRHGLIQVNLLAALRALLRGTACRALGSDNFIRVGGSLRLPDAMVICRDIQDEGRITVDPTAVFEILSNSTADTDRFEKAQEYWDTPSIQHYVMLEQGRIGAVVLSRGPDGWVRRALTAGAAITLAAIGVALDLAEIYEGLRFPEPPQEAAESVA